MQAPGISVVAVFLVAVGCGSDENPTGSLQVTVNGLVEADTVTLSPYIDANILSEGGFVAEFTAVGNGIHVKDGVPVGKYKFQCANPTATTADGRDRYNWDWMTELPDQELLAGSRAYFECSYHERAYAVVNAPGLPVGTLAESVRVATLTPFPSGQQIVIGPTQVDVLQTVDPGQYDVACNLTIGSYSLTSGMPARRTIAGGAVQSFECAYAP